MSRFKTVRTNFTSLPNDVIQGFYLSPNAIAVLITCLSYPDDWEYRPIHVWKKLRLSRNKTYSAFDELTEKGHCIRIRNFKGNLKANVDYIFFDQATTCYSYIKEHEKELSGDGLEVNHKWNFKKCLRHSNPRYVESREPEGREVLKKIEKKRSYKKESTHESKAAPPPTRPNPPTALNQQGLGNSIAPSAISNSDSNPLHEDFEEEDFEPVPRTRKYLTKRELNSPEYKELLELSASGKLNPFFKAHVLKGWIPKWSPYLTLETIHYFLKQYEKQAQTDNPILKPEAWMEDAFKNEYTTQLKIRKQNEEFARLMKRIHNFHPLEIKAWYCIDTQPGGEDLPYNMPPERFEYVLMRMINRYKEVRSLKKEE